jgi:hypothetical protein
MVAVVVDLVPMLRCGNQNFRLNLTRKTKSLRTTIEKVQREENTYKLFQGNIGGKNENRN